MSDLQVIQFRAEDFPMSVLMSGNLNPGGNVMGVEELGDEGTSLSYVAQLASNYADEGVNFEDLLYVVADEDGMSPKVYGPAVFAEAVSEEENSPKRLVLRIGGNVYPINLDKGRMTCGLLYADSLDFEQKQNLTGEHYLIGTVQWSVETTDGSGENYMIITGLRINSKEYPTKSDADCKGLKKRLNDAFKKGDLVNYLTSMGQGGGASAVEMHELGSGEHPLDGIRILELQDKTNPERYYHAFILQLRDGRECWSKGGSSVILNDSEQRWRKSLVQRNKVAIKNGSDKVVEQWTFKGDVMLKIGKIEPYGDGKWKVPNQLIEKAPQLVGAVQSGQASLLPADDF